MPVLGFSALQLSPDRDPLAPHAEPARPDHADLRSLVARGWLRNLPPALLATPPRIGRVTDRARGARIPARQLRPLPQRRRRTDRLELVLAQHAERRRAAPTQTLASLLGHSSRFRPHGAVSAQRVARGGDGAAC